jgi:DNA-binding beta-propeller fold protein YncE
MSVGAATLSLGLAATAAVICALASAATAIAAGNAPVKQVIVSHIGREADQTTKGGICTVSSGDVCQHAKVGSEAGAFEFTKSVAGGPAPEGNVYVADGGNNRVQELTASGEFVLMFGRHVNATTGGDVCTETEILTKGVKCQKGEVGGQAGALASPGAVAVDPSDGSVYVSESSHERVDKYTSAGVFVWTIGKEVNKTTKANFCSQKEIENEGVECQAGVFVGLGVTEHGVFVFPASIAVGPGHTLYVGDEHRVQEFDGEGKWVAEISTPLEQISTEPHSVVSMLAVDSSANVFLVYEVALATHAILEFDPSGKKIAEFDLSDSGASFGITSIAVDQADRLAVVDSDKGEAKGLLYQVEAGSGLRLITEFVTKGASSGSTSDEGIAFNGNDDLYAAASSEVVAYKHVAIGDLAVVSVNCSPGAEQETDVRLDCELLGNVDPWGVDETEVWFEWGRTSILGEVTAPPIAVPAPLADGEEEPPVDAHVPISGVRPNEVLYLRMAGEDAQVKKPEMLTSPTRSFTTASVPPRIVGELNAWFVKPSAADLAGEINPENADTTYEFQYAPVSVCQELEGCGAALHSKSVTTNVYGKVGVMLEADGLQPATEYRYRLYASNDSNQTAVNQAGEPVLPEGKFTTPAIPAPSVVTGLASGVGQSTATISGTVNPDGQEATYSFELGVYEGSQTEFGTVHSGAAGAGTVPVEEALALTDLQPGTTYAYRIAVKSNFIANETHTTEGAVGTFTTAPLSTGVVGPPAQPMLGTPHTIFPNVPAAPSKCRRGFRRSKSGKCVRAKKTKSTKNGKGKGRAGQHHQ